VPPVLEVLALMAAGVGAGLAGSVAGLASLISYPALLAAGLPPLAANVTNTVALTASSVGAAAGSVPELRGQGRRIARMAALMAVGGAAGAALLLALPAAAFEGVVPVLVAGASAVLLAQPVIRRAVARHHPAPGQGAADGRLGPRQTAGTLGVAVYGGYFGAAAGVMMLALLQGTSDEPLARSNAVKNVLLGVSNGVASVGFLVLGPVAWSAAAAMAAGILVGSWAGPWFVRRAPAAPLRIAIGLAGLALAARLAIDAW
jgi:uncharacterized protein